MDIVCLVWLLHSIDINGENGWRRGGEKRGWLKRGRNAAGWKARQRHLAARSWRVEQLCSAWSVRRTLEDMERRHLPPGYAARILGRTE